MKAVSFSVSLLLVFLFVSCKKSDDPAPAFNRQGKVFAGSPQSVPYPIIPLALFSPKDLAVDAAGNLYVADCNHGRVVKISTDSTVSVVADYQNTGINSFEPTGLTVDADGNVYVADQSNHLIFKITAAGIATIVAGSGSAGFVNGNGTAASFNQPTDIAVDASGNLYVTDRNNHVIRKITALGEVTTYAGSGTAGSDDGALTEATFTLPYGITINTAGTLYVTDAGNGLVRWITSAYVGNAVDERQVGVKTFHQPTAIALDAEGNVYVSDVDDWVIRKIDTHGHPTLFFGTERLSHAPASSIRLSYGLAATDSYVFATDNVLNWIVRIKK